MADGAMILGKLQARQFRIFALANIRNPHDDDCLNADLTVTRGVSRLRIIVYE